MFESWGHLGGLEKVFWFIAILASTIFLLQMILSFSGLHQDHDVDIADLDSPGPHIFTVRNFMAFFTLFGWVGLACIRGGVGLAATLASASLAGATAMLLVAGLLYFMSRLGEDATFDARRLVGAQARVYIPIPAARSGNGKISVTLGSVKELDAATDGEKLPTGTAVRIKAVLDGTTLLVERI